jgi:Tol biopolymer transport system component
MLAHREFAASPRMASFLRLVVEKSLSGETDGLKETQIGATVFDRPVDYDPKTDPVVRGEARRLRQKIERYYESAGVADPVRIEIPKGAYQAEFSLSSAIPNPPIPEPAQIPEPPRASRLWVLAGIAGFFLIAAAGSYFWWNQQTRVTARALPPQASTATSYPGREFDPSISPDGRQIAFVWDQGGDNFDLFVTNAGGLETPQRLTETKARELRPAWSPDGASIAFLRVDQDAVGVYALQLADRRERKLTEIRAFEWFSAKSEPLYSNTDVGPSWFPDGKNFVISDTAGDLPGSALWKVALDQKLRVQLTSPPALASDFHPSVSPSGRRLAFARQSSANSADLFVAEGLEGPGPATLRQLTADQHDIRGIAWLPDESGVVIATNRAGAYSLWRILLDAPIPEAIPAPGERIHSLAIAPDAARLVYTASRFNSNLWRYPILNAPPRLGAPQRLVASSGENTYPRYSPQGDRIAWASDRSGSWQIWVADAEGRNPRPITQLGAEFGARLAGTPRWSPDGKWIAFDARPGGKCTLYVIPSTGGQVRRVLNDGHEQRNPAWSRDGGFLYFNSDRNGRVQIWKVPVAGGEPALVTQRLAYDLAEDPQTGFLFYIPRSPEAGLWTLEGPGAPESLVPATAALHSHRHWDLNPAGLHFAGHSLSGTSFFRYRPETRELRSFGPLPSRMIPGINSLAVSPDGRWLLVSQVDEFSSDLLQLQGRLPELLPRR